MIKKVLVTGGAGFVGCHLVDRLLSEGQDVTVLDNLSRGNLQNLPNVHDDLKFVRGDINDVDLISGLIEDSDVVFHLAALSRVMTSIKNPDKCFDDNVHGVEVIARLCSKYHKKLVFSSSREVYGNALYTPVDEDHPLTPENPYGVSKLCGEKIIVTYSKCYSLKYSILRLANVYGYKDFQRVIPTFVEKTIKDQALVVFGGQQIIDFVHVNDVVDVLLKASNNNENITVNIGSGKGTTVLEIARLIQEIGHCRGRIIHKKKRQGEVECFIAKIDTAKKLLNWAPKTELKAELTRLLYSDRTQLCQIS